MIDDATGHITITHLPLPDGGLTIAVSGALTITTAPAFDQYLRAVLDHHPGVRLELDLSEVEFCDLAGWRALHAVGHHPVCITAVSEPVDVLLRLLAVPAPFGHPHP